MKAFCIGEAGAQASFQERPSVSPGPDELRVRVAASALNRADLLQLRGRYPAPPGVPQDIPGLEYAGEVIGVGARVTRFRAGDRVMGLVGGGAFAEELVTHEREAMAIPEGLSWVEAAAIPEAFLTAYDALMLQAGLRGTERVLIHAVTSGVGTAAAQLASQLGATVVGTSRSAEKLAEAAHWGVHHPIVVPSDPPRFAEAVRALVGGVDVVLDLVGGSYLPEAVNALAPRGRILLVGVLGGASCELPLHKLLNLRASVTGTVLRSRPLEEKILLAQDFARRALPLFSRGLLRPVIDSVDPISELPRALERMASSSATGKLVVTW
jgi:putative PIG3 family NAD(P)H quinone oxidoreductase